MRVIIDHHRTNGNAESFATKEYRTNDSDDDVDDDVADDDDNDVDEDDNTDDNVDYDAMHEVVVLSAFGDEKVEDLVRPTITRSGRSITRRSEIDVSYFCIVRTVSDIDTNL